MLNKFKLKCYRVQLLKAFILWYNSNKYFFIFQLMDTIFSFLARQTDFYINGKEGCAEQVVMTSFKKYEKIAMEEKLKKQKERERQEKKREEKQQKIAMQNGNNRITELTDEEAEKLAKEIEMKKVQDNEESKVDSTGDAKDDEEVNLFKYVISLI